MHHRLQHTRHTRAIAPVTPEETKSYPRDSPVTPERWTVVPPLDAHDMHTYYAHSMHKYYAQQVREARAKLLAS
eukprot:8883071-Pyramimonas_sp.AAC.1